MSFYEYVFTLPNDFRYPLVAGTRFGLGAAKTGCQKIAWNAQTPTYRLHTGSGGVFLQSFYSFSFENWNYRR